MSYPGIGLFTREEGGRTTLVHDGPSSEFLGLGDLAKHGFTQYRKVGKGKYEKTTGNGPPTISDD